MRKLKFLILLIAINSCSTQKDISGLYISNFADNGFFVKRLRLKSDSSFEYISRGDLMCDTAFGYYKIVNNKLFLFYTPITHLYFSMIADTSISNGLKCINYPIKSDTERFENYPSLYYIRHDKLIDSLHKTGYEYIHNKGFHRKLYLKRIDI